METDDWWRAFFSGVLFDFLEQFRSDDDTADEADFLERHLLAAGSAAGPLLDVPCGEGRLAVELAGRGHAVVGVDVAPDALERAHRRAEERGVGVDWRQEDMRRLDSLDPASVGGAFNFGNSWGYFGEDGDRAAARAVFGRLAPGGAFALESRLTAEIVLPGFVENDWHSFGKDLLLMRSHYEPAGGEMVVDYTFVRDGARDTRRAHYRVYTLRELVALLESVGFESVETYGSLYDDEPFRLGDDALWLVARKPE
jgi:SAM-dependent methyltransferase